MISSFSEKINTFIKKINVHQKTKVLTGIINSHLLQLDENSLISNDEDEINELKIMNLMNALEERYEKLLEADFFLKFGFYIINKDNILKIIEILNKMIKFSNKNTINQIPFIEFSSSHMKIIDTEIEKLESKIQKFKKKVNQISNELTLIFWMQKFEYEDVIDIKMFFQEMTSFLKILNVDFEDLDKKNILDNVDLNRSQSITIKLMDNFFYFCWSFPPPFKKEESKQNESEQKLTLKKSLPAKQTVKKKQGVVEIEKKKTIENIKSEIYENFEEEKKKTILDKNREIQDVAEFKTINKTKLANDYYGSEENENDRKTNKNNIIKYEDYEDHHKIKETNHENRVELKENEEEFGLGNVVKNESPSENCFKDQNKKNNRVLKIRIKELDKLHKDSTDPKLLKLNDLICFYDTYYLRNMEKCNYSGGNVCKIGRNSSIKDYIADIKIHEDSTSFSRKQFQFLFNQDNFKVNCTTPPPKTETSYRIIDSPFYIKEGQVINFRAGEKDCYFFILKLSGANKKNKDLSSGDDFNTLLKQNKAKTFDILNGKNNDQNNNENQNQNEIDETITFKIQKINIDFISQKTYEVNLPEFQFGDVDGLRSDFLKQFNCKVKLENGIGWSLICPNYEIESNNKVLIPLASYEQLRKKEPSDSKILEKNQCLYLANFHFFVEDIIDEE